MCSKLCNRYQNKLFVSEYSNAKVDETDYKSSTLQNLNDKLNRSPPDKYVNKGFSNEIEQQLEELTDYENKINNVLLEKIAEFINENKELSELNKTSQIDLKSLQNSMTEAQKDAETWKVNYKVLQLQNKDLLVKLHNNDKFPKNNDVDNSDDLSINKLKLSNEPKHSNNITLSQEGSFVKFELNNYCVYGDKNIILHFK